MYNFEWLHSEAAMAVSAVQDWGNATTSGGRPRVRRQTLRPKRQNLPCTSEQQVFRKPQAVSQRNLGFSSELLPLSLRCLSPKAWYNLYYTVGSMLEQSASELNLRTKRSTENKQRRKITRHLEQ
eukprot:gb/GECG01011331.1/.p1 GENE.gb/GECG01011331.1/~~gb/GECG01011331.1/.p1  ORF type:complete len:125 (+),score=11.80 gb/GECG01011331.1/:1-375(+)